MKTFYPKQLFTVCVVMLISSITGALYAQCPHGSTNTGTAYDTTFTTPTGDNTILLKFRQFDPEVGMVNCVRLCITITGVVNFASVENNSSSNETGNIRYQRTDQITGPGLVSPLTNSIDYQYGPFSLGPSDGVFNSGPDYFSVVNDTLLNSQTICFTLTDPADLEQFYGDDSVTYTYNISAKTTISCTGGNYNSAVATSAFVNFHFEYCACSIVTLPLNIQEFFAKKITNDKAELTWSGYDDPETNYKYVVEASNDGQHFSTVFELPKVAGDETHIYKYVYTEWDQPGIKYFRIKQVYSNGYTRFTEIRSVELRASTYSKFLVYPNPSEGIVGIKFVNSGSGQMMAQIYNSSGQCVARKEATITGTVYWQITTLSSGMYWLKLTDQKTRQSSITQLLIK